MSDRSFWCTHRSMVLYHNDHNVLAAAPSPSTYEKVCNKGTLCHFCTDVLHVIYCITKSERFFFLNMSIATKQLLDLLLDLQLLDYYYYKKSKATTRCPDHADQTIS